MTAEITTEYAVTNRPHTTFVTGFITTNKEVAERECVTANRYRDGADPYRVVAREVVTTKIYGKWG